MTLPYISLADARNLHLAAQGLLKKYSSSALPNNKITSSHKTARCSGSYLPHALAANRHYQYRCSQPLFGAF